MAKIGTMRQSIFRRRLRLWEGEMVALSAASLGVQVEGVLTVSICVLESTDAATVSFSELTRP